ncbi:MAG TPA: hypothetical protein VK932_24530, partial [Kofleriaceae bacterium]|nr:hypothetical protein [Kofleriaceae bacterium]
PPHASSPAPPAPARRPPPPGEPVGVGCLTHAKVEAMLEQLRISAAPHADPREVRLVEAQCHKRSYVIGDARFILWEIGGGEYLRGKGTSAVAPVPSEACIERALAQAVELVPFAERIMKREAAQDPELWRDPDVGMVSFLDCKADRPAFESIATMLHETNHRIGRGACIFELATGRDLCFELDAALPPGKIAAFPEAPAALDPTAAGVFLRLQNLYLERNAQGILELLDEVTAYRVEAEMYAVGITRKLYPKPGTTTYLNLPAMMALATRYLDELARRDPALAAKEFGPRGRNREALMMVLDQAEASYRTWLAAAKRPGVYERTFWDEYQRTRKRWLARE